MPAQGGHDGFGWHDGFGGYYGTVGYGSVGFIRIFLDSFLGFV